MLTITIFDHDYDYDACVTRDKALHIIGVAGLLKEFEKNPLDKYRLLPLIILTCINSSRQGDNITQFETLVS